MAKVRTDFRHTNKLKDNIQNKLTKLMFKAGSDYRIYIEKQWDKGKNGENKNFKKLSSSYAKYKSREGKKPISDLRLSSSLIQSLTNKMKGKLTTRVGFLPAEKKKASYVAERNDNVGIWGITKKKANQILKDIYKGLSPK